ncbi:hypothetical protein PINS_up003098 [Pythium insidiosum]|nr:hypothetical protein PINS_up003098 [Pythium insidiosum]
MDVSASWLHSYDVSVPTCRVLSGVEHRVVFAVTLAPRERPETRRPRASVCTTHRPYSAFRALRKTLQATTAPPSAWHRMIAASANAATTTTTSATSTGSKRCVCAGDACAFHALRHVLHETAFPARHVAAKGRRMRERRDGLESWLQAVCAFFAARAVDDVAAGLRDDACATLAAIVQFVGAKDHFPAMHAMARRRPARAARVAHAARRRDHG